MVHGDWKAFDRAIKQYEAGPPPVCWAYDVFYGHCSCCGRRQVSMYPIIRTYRCGWCVRKYDRVTDIENDEKPAEWASSCPPVDPCCGSGDGHISRKGKPRV